jgi:hypothetical protein
VDLFGKAPRVQTIETEPGDPDWASRHVVAQMKKTDRDKDWPYVDGLGLQLWIGRREDALLHIRNPERLRAAWLESSPNVRKRLAARRPLLHALDLIADQDQLQRLLMVERILWQCLDQDRYRQFTSAWKEFFRRWRQEPDWQWPTSESFFLQHGRLLKAVHDYGMPANPIPDAIRPDIVGQAIRRTAVLTAASAEEIAIIQPPLTELLP